MPAQASGGEPAQAPTSLRAARAADADRLSELALRSKAYWGYSQTFLAQCRDELRVEAGRLTRANVLGVTALRANVIVGFYLLTQHDEFELDALFVTPEQIGTGVGRRLLTHALDAVAARGGHSLVVQSDPNAAPFYRRAGGRRIGWRRSGSVARRQLPVYRIPTPAASPRESSSRAR